MSLSAVGPEDSTQQGLRCVAIGGGTGLSRLLEGLKRHVDAPRDGLPAIADLSAIVTVSDDGGSSGRLRKDLNILPPGDIRNCMVALAEDEALMSRLFQYRFAGGAGLEGHSFGNLFLAALTAVTGDFSVAVRESSSILASRGTIYPATTSNVQLDALMYDDSRVRGETKITASRFGIKELRLVPANARPLPEALAAIAAADLITIGPGSLFTSLIPNLLVRGIVEAIAASKAMRIFVCNLMTQANESLGLSASEHVRAIERHARRRLFDCVLVNTAPIPKPLLARYALEGASPIVVDREALQGLGRRVIEGDFVASGDVLRHASDRVAGCVLAAAVTRGAETGAAAQA